jgi:peptidyl-prolyl cis-trans isomerase SurA
MVSQTHVRHILIKVDPATSGDKARRTLERLRIRISGGEDFATIAKARSDDTGSAPKGGDLGWVNPGDLVPQFEQAMNAMQPGELGRPFATQFGMHLAQVLERRSQDNTNQFLRNQAREAITERKAEEDLDSWLRRLRDEAYVDIRLGQENQ